MQYHPFTEAEALSDLQRSQESGLDYYFQRYYTQLTFYIQSFIHNPVAAQEIASDAFVKLWHYRSSIASPSKVKALLFRMCYNSSIDYIREQKTATRRLHNVPSPEATTQHTTLEKLVTSETYQRLYQLLQTLSPRSRQIFFRYYFQNKTLGQIASELGISINSVKTQKLRALQLLRRSQNLLTLLILATCFFG